MLLSVRYFSREECWIGPGQTDTITMNDTEHTCVLCLFGFLYRDLGQEIAEFPHRPQRVEVLITCWLCEPSKLLSTVARFTLQTSTRSTCWFLNNPLMLVFSIKGRLNFNLIVVKRETFPHPAFLQSKTKLVCWLMWTLRKLPV